MTGRLSLYLAGLTLSAATVAGFLWHASFSTTTSNAITNHIANGAPLEAQPPPPDPRRQRSPAGAAEYQRAIAETAGMVGNPEAKSLAAKHGLDILNVTWEDTGRYKGSAVGPNISDMTIQVGFRDPATNQFRVTCMPVIRYPNFSDLSCDLDPRDFTLLVGNHAGQPLRRISLYDFLAHPRSYLTNPASWRGERHSLLAPRDAKVLVSAQACFLPIPKSGKATFNPVIFNYQSVKGDPAVLTILVTREGTSATIIDNARDAFATGAVWGQRLFFNANGQRASLTGERESDFVAQGGDKTSPKPSAPGGESGLNLVLLIQVPLKQKHHPRAAPPMPESKTFESAAAPRDRASDVENAVIGHGDLEGPFTEIDNLAIERDERFPVRVTVQFYKATSNGIATEADIAAIKAQIERVYAQSEYAGSLVTGGETGRVTEYDGVKVQPTDWWEDFWQRYEANTGISRYEAIQRLRQLLGTNFRQQPVCELYLRDVLRRGAPRPK
ncbi:MAG: hypothetical protein CFK52_04270 [Chloracidobacterium sp. CP2_5A]|nr:MAG: hypothetical protein CFK52_04270 [Chloracidobacterium sp. CP2_5A]